MKALLIALWLVAGVAETATPTPQPVAVAVENVRMTVPAGWRIVSAEAAAENMEQNVRLRDQPLQRRFEGAVRRTDVVAIRYDLNHVGINPTVRLTVSPISPGEMRNSQILLEAVIRLLRSAVADLRLEGEIVPLSIGEAEGSMVSVRYNLHTEGGSLPVRSTVRLLIHGDRMIHLGTSMGLDEREDAMRDFEAMLASLRIGRDR